MLALVFARLCIFASRVCYAGRRVVLAFLVLALSACQGGYLQNGIGSQLAASDFVQSSNIQSAYFAKLCQQVVSGDCSGAQQNNIWTLIVRQGMNDIDRRCDAYLEWLDNKRRSRGPLLAQIGAIHDTANAIMGIVGTGAAAISIVAQGFGLITRSIDNYHSRLLLEVDKSTVDSVVLLAQRRFRDGIAGENYYNRPDAEYVLRAYLRLCLPFIIETNINNYSTLGAQGIQVTEANSIVRAPVLGRRLLDSIPSGGGKGEAKPNPQPTGGKFLSQSLHLTKDEKAMAGTGTPEIIQMAICVLPADGVFGKATRTAIVQAKQGLNFRQPGFVDNTDTLDTAMIDFFSKQSSCVNHERGYLSAFEKFAYPTKNDISGFQGSLKGCDVALGKKTNPAYVSNIQITGSFDQQTRKAIETIRSSLKFPAGSLVDQSLQVQLSQCLN
jgi:hypothetical protein